MERQASGEHSSLQPPSGMKSFITIWLGQLISLVGTGMAQFALTIWAWQETGSATALSLVAVFNFAPTVLLSPIAGALVDRWNRKLTMMLSDLLSGAATVGVLTLFSLGRLEIWHLYLAGMVAGSGQAFQWPAYSAAISTMLPKKHYARANGMLGTAQSASTILAPILAGTLLVIIGIGGVLAIDIVTFSIAVLILLLIPIPQPKESPEGAQSRGSLWSESVYGFRYILERKALLGLQLVFTAINFVTPLALVLLAPMILARTGNNELALGTVQSVLGVGGLVGGLVMSVWGGPRRRIHGVLLGMIGSSVLGVTVIGLGRDILVWSAGAFLAMFFLPIINGCNQAIWQAKVAPDIQGKVFAARRMIAQLSAPAAMLIAGPLADFFFEPLLSGPGRAAPYLTRLVGVGDGAGMSLMFVLAGMLGALVGLSGYLNPNVRRVESMLPDHDAVSAAPAPAALASEPANLP